VIVDAYPDADLTGRLTFIGALATSEAFDKSREKYFQVIFKINEEDDRLRPGMTCRAFIQAESISNALTVPIQAVFSENQRDICYVRKKGGGFEKRTVTTGRQNDAFVEITDGLQQEEKVSLVRQMID
jgi:multidrug efflux pump subunit AcrA (membrane-fusion protein)